MNWKYYLFGIALALLSLWLYFNATSQPYFEVQGVHIHHWLLGAIIALAGWSQRKNQPDYAWLAIGFGVVLVYDQLDFLMTRGGFW